MGGGGGRGKGWKEEETNTDQSTNHIKQNVYLRFPPLPLIDKGSTDTINVYSESTLNILLAPFKG